MDNWKKLDETRIYKEKDDITIIYPKNSAEAIPFTCPNCGLLMIEEDDANFYEEFKCCGHCSLKWAEPNKEKWANGWRPQKEEIIKNNKLRKALFHKRVNLDFKFEI